MSINSTTFNTRPVRNRLMLAALLLWACSSLPMLAQAEGTKTASVDSNKVTSLLTAPDLNQGSFLNAGEDNRVYVRIKDFATENIYFGFNWRDYVTGTAGSATNMYIQIRNPSGTVVYGPTLFTPSGAGYISSFREVYNGPNIAGTQPLGFTPQSYTPTANGDYYFEFFRSNNGGATSLTSSSDRAHSPIWDITVATAAGAVTNGRIHSDKWGFYATTPVTYTNFTFAQANPDMYAYTIDSTVLKLDIQAEFEPIAFTVSMNYYGIGTTGNWFADRKSQHYNAGTSPPLTNGYPLFVNIPDTTVYHVAPAPDAPVILYPPITGCTPPYTIHYSTAKKET